jgi:hypothetical protein
LKRLPGALVRALLVVLAVTAPSFLIPNSSASAREISVIIGAITGAFILFEYGAANPGLIDFRFAPPYNRARFAVFTAALLLLTFYVRAQRWEDPFSEDLLEVSVRLGALLDFPLSPVRLAGEILSDPAAPELDPILRGAAALSCVTGIVGAAFFGGLLWAFSWPTDRGNFNLWVNLPTFEIAYGRDVERRLTRLGALTVLAGLAAPYLMLLGASSAGGMFDVGALLDPLPLIWSAAIWGVAPPLIIMRGALILKIARLIRMARPEMRTA